MKALILPEGWEQEWSKDHKQVAINYPGEGFATLNFDQRGYSLGSTFHLPPTYTSANYAGRTWRQNIVDDAVAHLNKIYRD